MSLAFEPGRRDRRGAAGERPDLVGDDARGGVAGQPLGHQAGRDIGEAAVRGGQLGRVVGARDRIAELGGRARSVVQEIALRDHAGGRTGCIGDAQVPHPETVHAAERPIEHLVAPHRPYRRAHQRRHRRRIGVDVRVRRRPEEVALGHDPGRPGLVANDEQCADAVLGHHAGGLAKGSLGPDRSRGGGHHLIEPALVQEAVDTGEHRGRRRIGSVSRHRVPARLHLAADELGRASGERFGLAEGPHVRLPQPRNQGGEDPGRGEGVAERGVTLLDADAEPVRERFEPEVDEPSIECAGEMRDVESGGVAPGHAGARRLVAEHGEVEPDVLADDDPARERFPERLDELGEGRSPRDAGIGQPVDAGGFGGDGNPGVDVRVDAGLAPDGGPVHRHRADLDDPSVRDVEPGGLEIERDRGQRRKRGVARRTVRAGEG